MAQQQALTIEAEIKSEGLPEKEEALLECLVKSAKLEQLMQQTKAALENLETQKKKLLAEIERLR